MKKSAAVFITILSLVGLFSILYANSLAIGVGPDSTVYIASAKSLMQGDGLSIPTATGDNLAMTHFAPLYPSLLGILSLTGLDLNVVARGLNAFLFFTILFFVGYIILRSSGNFWLLAPSASLYLLASEDMLTIHSYAWSEPLFICLCILGLFLFSLYLYEPSSIKRIISVGILSLAFLTRYAGVALLPVVFLAALLFQEDEFPKRLLRPLGLTLACAAPALLWFSRNFLLSGSFSNRSLIFHPITTSDIRNGLDTISNWFLPGRITGSLRDMLVILFVATALVLISVALLTKLRNRNDQGKWTLDQTLPSIFALFSLFYFLLLIITLLFMDAQSTFNYRLLSPLLVSGFIVAMTLLPTFLKRISLPLQIFLGVFFSIIIGFNAVHSLKFVTKAHAGSFKMFAGKGWQEAEITHQLRTLSEDGAIYSNGDDAINYVTGKPAARFPHKSNPFSLQENPDYLQELNQMGETLRGNGGYIVCFTGITWRGYLPGCEELNALFPLTLRWSGDEGMIYTYGRE